MEQQILSEINETQYTIEKSPKNDEYTLIFSRQNRKNYVLSKYEPRKSALSSICEDKGNKTTIWIVFGFNFGYVIEQLQLEIDKNVRVFVIEPNKELLERELELYKRKDEILNSGNIQFFYGTEFVKFNQLLGKMFGNYDFNNFRIVSNEKYLEYYQVYFQTILTIIDESVQSKIIDFNTVILSNATYITNTVKNRREIATTSDMGKLHQKYRGIPAVIVSAGPSLDKNIGQLKNFNGLIFAMGRTLTPIQKLGIKPDFVVSLDAKDVIYETFGESKEYDVPLITLCQSNPKVVKGCKAERYFLYNSNELVAFTGARVNPVLDLSGSVATLCLSSATYLGCSPIMFIGQDLAFTGNRAYATQSNISPGAYIEDNPDLKLIKSFYGDKVWSDISMISFLRWIETFIYAHQECKYINCTEGGAFIEGCQHMSFKEAIEKYNPTYKIKVEHERLADNIGIDIEANFRSAVKQLREIKTSLSENVKYYNEMNSLYQKKKPNKKMIAKYFNKIQENDKKIAELPKSQSLMQMLMERVKTAVASSNDNKETLNETQQQRTIRQLKLNCETYRYLAKEAEYILHLIKDEIEGE